MNEQDSKSVMQNMLEIGKSWNEKNQNVKIGYYIKKHRKLNHLTQEQLGQAIGKTTSSIQKYESGKTEVPRSVLEKIASVLGLHVLDLLDDYSAMDWYTTRDEAIISLLNSIGCKVEFSSENNNGETAIHYKGNKYTLSEDCVLYDLFDDIEYDSIHLVEKIIRKKA